MKFVKLICVALILMFLVGGCSSKIVLSDKYVFGQDSQYNFTAGFYTDGGVTETQEGYYFISGPSYSFLYFYDKAKKQAIPVCNKPNCLHADEPDSYKIAQCNAYLSSGVHYLQYCNGALYYLATDSDKNGFFDALMRISPDGTKHEELLRFTDGITGLSVHRDAVYYATTDSGTIAGQEATTKTKYKLYRFDLEKPGAKPELIEEGQEINGSFGDNIFCYGNYVYYTVVYYKDATLTEQVGSLKRYDIRTKTVGTFIDTLVSEYTCFNGEFIYTLFGKGTFACDMDGKNSRQIYDQAESLTSNSNYLIMDNLYDPQVANGEAERKLAVVGRDWKTVKTVSLNGMKDIPLGCSDEYYFIPEVPGWGKTNEFGEIVSLYAVSLDKTPDDMQVQTFFDFVPKVPFNGITRKE